ncbi:MAG: DUF3179 domain-containing (seleno)protein [Anaerolineae bacterium]
MRWKIGLTVFLLFVLTGCSRSTSASAPDTATSGDVSPQPETPPTALPTPLATDGELLPPAPAPRNAEREFSTDFSRHTVPYDEVLSGGPPKDGIPAIDEPQHTTIEAADAWLDDQEPVIFVEVDDEARAYPIQILMWHEIVNDTLGDVPIAVTFCPLCNTAIAFDRRFADLILDFGTTGRLRFSNLIMYDRQTETWWQQATGEGIAGEFAGRELTLVPAPLISWADFKENYPDSKVLSRATGYARSYGQNPYAGYDNVNSSPFLYDGPETPGQLLPMARVLTVDLNGKAVAYPYDTMAQVRVANDTVGGDPIAVFWQPGVASALDKGAVSAGRDVGAVTTFSRELDGEILTFRFEDDRVIDEDTGSVWDVFGTAVEGPLTGRRLMPVVSINHFWFSWAAFKPETRVYRPENPSLESTPDSDEGKSSASSDTPVDSLAVDFDLLVYQGGEELGGELVRFSDVLAQGRPVVLSFWAGACPVCRRELPEVQAVYEQFGDEVVFFGLDVGAYTGLGDRDDALFLMEELGLTFPTGTTPEPTVIQSYRITGIPTTLYFRPNGELFDRSSGLTGADALREQIQALIAVSDL